MPQWSRGIFCLIKQPRTAKDSEGEEENLIMLFFFLIPGMKNKWKHKLTIEKKIEDGEWTDKQDNFIWWDETVSTAVAVGTNRFFF